MAFSESFLNELTEKNDIVSVVSEYVNLGHRSGANMFGLCPFHGEKTPSFSVSPSKQIYYCFGCHKGGGVINFVMEIENLSFRDAVEKLCDRVGMKMPEEEYDPDSQKRARLYAANKAAAKWFYAQLNSDTGGRARDYIKERKLTKTVCTNFGLGYAPESWNMLKDALNAQGFSDGELLDAGLIVENQKKPGNYYDKYRNRLMFPVIDVRGNVLGFSGRILGDGQPKYLNTPNTLIFDKGRNLFALNLAKNSKKDYIILAEGNVDVVSLHQAGFDSAVASLGTSLTEKQAQLLSRYTDRVIIAYDSDEAGTKAAERAIKIFERLQIEVKVLRFSGAKDPDEFIKLKGADAFRQLIEGSENKDLYKLRLIEEKYDLTDMSGKTSYLEEAEKYVAAIPSSARRQYFSSLIAEKIGITPSAVSTDVERLYKAAVRKGARREMKRDIESFISGTGDYTKPANTESEKGIIGLLTLDPSLIDYENLPEPEEFKDEKLRQIYTLLLQRLRDGDSISVSALSEYLDNESISVLVKISNEPRTLTSARTTLEDYIKAIRKIEISAENLEEILKKKRQGGGSLSPF